jgi:hypothetical protein
MKHNGQLCEFEFAEHTSMIMEMYGDHVSSM